MLHAVQIGRNHDMQSQQGNSSDPGVNQTKEALFLRKADSWQIIWPASVAPSLYSVQEDFPLAKPEIDVDPEHPHPSIPPSSEACD